MQLLKKNNTRYNIMILHASFQFQQLASIFKGQRSEHNIYAHQNGWGLKCHDPLPIKTSGAGIWYVLSGFLQFVMDGVKCSMLLTKWLEKLVVQMMVIVYLEFSIYPGIEGMLIVLLHHHNIIGCGL